MGTIREGLLGLTLVCGAAVACAGTEQPAPPFGGDAPGAPTRVDHAARLAERLPRGADRCTAARPALLSPGQRALYAQVAQSGPLAWLDGVRVLAYVSAERDRRRHPPASLTWLMLSDADRPRLRRLLSQRSTLDLRWDEPASAACTPQVCPTRARFVEPGLVRIERGAWPRVHREGAEVACRRLATATPGALEVRASRRRDGDVGRRLGLPLRTTATVVPLKRGARLERRDLMLGSDQAAMLVAGGGATPVGRPFGDLTVELSLSRTDALVYTRAEVLWEDLELARGDAQRRSSAEAYADALERITAVEDIDPRDPSQALAQAQLRLALLRASTAPDAGPLVVEAYAFLEAVVAAQPGNTELAALQLRLALDYTADAAATLRLAEARLAGNADSTELRSLRREAAARASTSELAAVLVADGLVDAAAADAAAARIRAALGAAASYTAAEREGIQPR